MDGGTRGQNDRTNRRERVSTRSVDYHLRHSLLDLDTRWGTAGGVRSGESTGGDRRRRFPLDGNPPLVQPTRGASIPKTTAATQPCFGRIDSSTVQVYAPKCRTPWT